MARKVIFTLLMMEGIVAVSEYCENLPEIRYSVNNMTGIYLYPEDISVHFSCLPEYRPEGNGIYKCLEGEWAGGPFSCIIKECPMLDSPKHGERIGDSYKIGDVMRFKCDNGYELIGSNTSLCRTNSKWHPSSIPECQIKKCPAVPSIEHGKTVLEKAINGQGGVYGAKLRVYCDNGYLLSGPVQVHCDANGQWTEIPKCKRVACPPYPGLDSKCLRRSKLEFNNTLLSIRCTEQSTFFAQGDGIASCDKNKWDDISMRCYCDCKVKGNVDLVIIENVRFNGFLKHNQSLIWSCKNESTKATDEILICNDGFIKTPVCVAHLHSGESPNGKSETNITIIVVICVLVAVIIFIILAIFINKWRKGKLSICHAKHYGSHPSQCHTEQRTNDEETLPDNGMDLHTEKADTTIPKSYQTTVNIETRGKQGKETEDYPVNKEITLNFPYTEVLLEAKKNGTEEKSVSGKTQDETNPCTEPITRNKTSPLNEQNQFAGLKETAHEKEIQSPFSLDQNLHDESQDKQNDNAEEGKLLTGIISNDEKDITAAAQRNSSMKNTEELVSLKDSKETADKKHICGVCNVYVPLSEEDWIGNQVYHSKCAFKSLYKSRKREKE